MELQSDTIGDEIRYNEYCKENYRYLSWIMFVSL